MKIKCINKSRAKAALTEGKEYFVEVASPKFYTIEDDNGEFKDVSKKRFKFVLRENPVRNNRCVQCLGVPNGLENYITYGNWYKVVAEYTNKKIIEIIDDTNTKRPYDSCLFSAPITELRLLKIRQEQPYKTQFMPIDANYTYEFTMKDGPIIPNRENPEPKEWVRVKNRYSYGDILQKGQFYKLKDANNIREKYYDLELFNDGWFKFRFENPVTKSEMERILKEEAKLKEKVSHNVEMNKICDEFNKSVELYKIIEANKKKSIIDDFKIYIDSKFEDQAESLKIIINLLQIISKKLQ